jgi:hypothetical protein
MQADNLFRLPGRSPQEILTELVALRNRSRSGEPLTVPPVTLLLDAGHQLKGEVIAITEATLTNANTADFTLLLKNAITDWEVTYIPGSAIRGVTVHLTPETAHQLAFGKFRALTEKVPTRLELERYLRTLATQLNPTTPLDTTIAWDEFPTADTAFQQLGDILQDLQATLLAIQSNDLGATALQTVRRLALRVDVKAGVRLQTGELIVHVKIVDHELVTLSRSELRLAIEQLL